MKLWGLYRWFVGNGWTHIGNVEAASRDEALSKAKSNILWNDHCAIDGS